MNFNDWILKETPRKVARQLKVDPASVCSWQKRKTCPRPQKMRTILKLSGGKVTYNDIINYYLRVKN